MPRWAWVHLGFGPLSLTMRRRGRTVAGLELWKWDVVERIVLYIVDGLGIAECYV